MDDADQFLGSARGGALAGSLNDLLPDVILDHLGNRLIHVAPARRRVQTLAGMLLPSATVFLLLLCNDLAVLGPWVNGRWTNLFTGAVIAVLVLLLIVLTASVLYPDIWGSDDPVGAGRGCRDGCGSSRGNAGLRRACARSARAGPRAAAGLADAAAAAA